MTKIGLLTCLRSNDVCPRVGCLEALSAREDYFSVYAAQEIELAAVWTCQGCDNLLLGDESARAEKLQCVLQSGIQTVHIGCCCKRDGVWCPEISNIACILEQHGIKVIWGTHK